MVSARGRVKRGATSRRATVGAVRPALVVLVLSVAPVARAQIVPYPVDPEPTPAPAPASPRAPKPATPDAAARKPTCAVLDFAGALDRESLNLLSDSLRSALAETRRFRVQSRAEMLSVVQQTQAFNQSDACDEACSVETGRLLQVQFIASGHVDRAGGATWIFLQLTNVESGELEKSLREPCPDCALDAIIAKVDALAARLAGVGPLLRGSPAAPAAALGAVTMAIDAPPGGRWLLHSDDGEALCALPCSQAIPRGNGYSVERAADRADARRRIDVPAAAEFSEGRKVKADYVAGRGNRTTALIAVGGGALGAVAGLVVGLTRVQCISVADSTGVLHGTTVASGACDSSHPTDPGGGYSTETVGSVPGIGLLSLGAIALGGGVAYYFWSAPERFEASLTP